MRALPICLVALMLSGCSMLSRSPVEPVQSTAPQPKAEPAKPKAPRATPVRIYTNAEELVGKPFRDLGEVSGDSCQASNPVSYTHLTLPTTLHECRSRWSPYH